jgi:uncharacterized protein YgfB (UPF0149 family)
LHYERLRQQLHGIGLDIGPAESHGIFCGMLCGGGDDPQTDWMAEVLKDQDPGDLLIQECASALAEVAAATRQAIDGPGMRFSPLLPDDDRPVSERARALGEWCQGFLFGLGTTGTTDASLSSDAAEALSDLAAIARLDGDAAADTEQDDEYYTELQEFVWVAAMLIYEERARRAGE